MYRITSVTRDGKFGGLWRVLEGADHTPTRLDNPNLFFETLSAARRAVRELNR